MTATWQTIVAVPDTHVPDHHVRAFANVTRFIGDLQPDRIIQLGDFLDCPTPARWNKGRAAEYSGTLQAELDIAYSLFKGIRELYAGPFDFIEGNHEARINNYLNTYAPAFTGLRGMDLAALMRLDALEVVMRPQPYRIAPGWLALHGDKLAPYAGGSAMKMVKFLGQSIIQGHSHRLGVINDTTDRCRTGVEAGHLSDVRKASYISYGQANWQMGFAILHIKGAVVHPEVVPVRPNGSFAYQSVDYGPAAA